MNPVIIEDTQSIAANATVENVIVLNSSLRGLLRSPYPARIRLLCVQSAAGLRIDALHAGSLYVSSSEPRIATFAEDPLDVVNDEVYCQSGEQNVIRVVNTTAGALTFRYRLIMMPLVDESWVPGQAIDLPPDTVVMQRTQSIAAASIDIQLLDGLVFERNPVPSILRVLMTQSAIGMLRQLYIDQNRVAPPSTISIANRVPQDPFDTTIEDIEVPENALQQLLISNPTGGALVVAFKVKNRYLIRT